MKGRRRTSTDDERMRVMCLDGAVRLVRHFVVPHFFLESERDAAAIMAFTLYLISVPTYLPLSLQPQLEPR